MKKTGVLLKAPPLGSLQWEQLSVLSLFLSVPSASWQAQTAGMRGCSVLLFAGLQGCERLVPCCCCWWWWWCRCWLLSWGLNGLDYTTVHCTALQCNALADCCFSSTMREEEPLPGAPARHGCYFLCVVWWLPDGEWRQRKGPLLSSFSFLGYYIVNSCICPLLLSNMFYIYNISANVYVNNR